MWVYIQSPGRGDGLPHYHKHSHLNFLFVCVFVTLTHYYSNFTWFTALLKISVKNSPLTMDYLVYVCLMNSMCLFNDCILCDQAMKYVVGGFPRQTNILGVPWCLLTVLTFWGFFFVLYTFVIRKNELGSFFMH